MSKKNDPTPTRTDTPGDNLATTPVMQQLVAAVEGIALGMPTKVRASSASDYERRFLALRRALAIRPVDDSATVATTIVPPDTADPSDLADSIQTEPS
jgi:hypothetical protein